MSPVLLAAVAATPAVKVASPAANTKTLTLTPEQIQQLQALGSNGHQTALAQHAPWLTHTLAGVFIIAALALIALLASQTTKNEGLSGSIGGRVESAYKGRLGFDRQIARITTVAAIVFVVFATCVSFSGI
jgi:protein translocase SecG subunit